MTRFYALAFVNAILTVIITALTMLFPFLHPFMIVHYLLIGILGSLALVALLSRLFELERRMVKSASTTQILGSVQEQVVSDYNRLLRIKGAPPIDPPLPMDNEYGRDDAPTNP